MFNVRMHASIGNESKKMQCGVLSLTVIYGSQKLCIFIEISILYGLSNSGKLLIYDSAGAIFICPTSELPICPSGRPTYSPDACPSTKGYSFSSRSMTGVSAIAIALPTGLGLIPYPSRIRSTTGLLSVISTSALSYLLPLRLKSLRDLK
jgi:hypothetical protein